MAKTSTNKMMRMKQLMEETGVTKATVQFYINEGLIPKPVKTHPNMAYYTDEHVKAIRMVKELQSKRFLPLSVIRQVMKGGKGGLTVDEIRTLVEIDGKLFQNINVIPEMKPMTAKELAERTGVSLEDIRIMEKAGMINPIRRKNKKLYHDDDIRIVESFGKIKDIVSAYDVEVDAGDIRIHFDLMKILVEEEAKLMTSRVSGKVPIQDLPKMIEDAAAILNNIMALFHKKIIVETTKRYTDEFQKMINR